jgi:hypothetical protein
MESATHFSKNASVPGCAADLSAPLMVSAIRCAAEFGVMARTACCRSTNR